MSFNKYTLQKIALTLSIIIVLNLFFNYGIYTFYPSPKYDNFCTEETHKYYDKKESCEAIGGEWVAYQQGVYPKYIESTPQSNSETVKQTEYCDNEATCRKQYEGIVSLYNRNVFIVLVILGVISVALGFFLVSVSAVSSGFLFGGLISFFIGTIRFWSNMDDYIRLIVLGIVLATLIWLGYRKLKDKESNDNK